MNAIELINNLSKDGARFEMEGEGFRILAPRGLVSEGMRAELAAAKPEILALLKLSDGQVQVSHIAGNCPHCKAPLLVYTHSFDDEVWIQCPTKADLFKALSQAAPAWCTDCGRKLPDIAGRCAECIQRLMLAPDEPCQICGSVCFWRHRASKDKLAGFVWYCADCKEPSGKVAQYEVRL